MVGYLYTQPKLYLGQATVEIRADWNGWVSMEAQSSENSSQSLNEEVSQFTRMSLGRRGSKLKRFNQSKIFRESWIS